MRLFAAIRFSPAVEEALWAAVGDLRRRGAGGIYIAARARTGSLARRFWSWFAPGGRGAY